MSDSSLKTILGVAAVGAAGVGAIYLLNKKSIDSAFGQIGEALGGVGQALGDFGSGISQGFDDFSKSLGDFGNGITQGFNGFSKQLGDFGSGIQKGIEDVSQDITDQGTDFRKGVTLLSGGLGAGLLSIYEWLTGNPTTTVNVTVNDREESTRSVPGEFDPVKSLQFKPLAATDATAIATVTSTPTPITEVNTTASQVLIDKYGLTESGNLNFGQGKKVTGIRSDNKFVGNILKSMGFTVDDDSYVQV